MVALYTVTLLVSATLLFLVQPMVGKMILPALGGAPSVWNTCMVFFQAALLLGYLYAHLSVRWLGHRRQAWLHFAVLLLPLAFLPLQLFQLDPPTDSDPAWWLLSTLTLRVGPVFVVVAASAPLLQRWFAASGHPSAHDPYFLYAASNIGSLTALLGYPLLVEPWLDVSTQAGIWQTLYFLLVALFFVCILMQRSTSMPQMTVDPQAAPISNETRLWWILTALVPSSLMLGVTTHITTNLAAIPLLWVLPLALYLVTFILVFAQRPLWTTAQMSRFAPFLVLPLALLLFIELPTMGWAMVPLHLVGFFVLTMICHGQLAASRPAPQRLTEFYLLMSLGGVLGGIFNALVAPLLFDHLVEYPLMLMVALLLRPGTDVRDDGARPWIDLVVPFAIAGVGIAGTSLVRSTFEDASLAVLAVGFLLPALLAFGFKERSRRFALTVGAMLLICGLDTNGRIGEQLRIERNFFGLKRVVAAPDGTRYALVHGGIEHGSQFIAPQQRATPLTYYHPDGPVGDVFATMQTSPRQVGVVGLGVGSVAAYARDGDQFTYFEIDPQVAQMALDPRYFAYLHRSAGRYEIVLGDGRLTVARQPVGHFDLLMIDAFGSDSIPTHLLTLEALDSFMQRVRPDGIMLIHISNRYLDLEPLLANASKALGWQATAIIDLAPEAEISGGRNSSHYVAIARDAQRLQRLTARPDWRPARSDAGVGTWTDQHTDLLRVMRWY